MHYLTTQEMVALAAQECVSSPNVTTRTASGTVTGYQSFDAIVATAARFSQANVDATGNPAAQSATTQASIFATANGLGGNGGVEVIYNDSVGGAKWYLNGTSASTGRMDAALDGELCLRNLVTGVDSITGAPLTGTALANSTRVRAGMNETLLNGNLQAKPTVIVHGRSDTLVPVNHNTRAYSGVEWAGRILRRTRKIWRLSWRPLNTFSTLFPRWTAS